MQDKAFEVRQHRLCKAAAAAGRSTHIAYIITNPPTLQVFVKRAISGIQKEALATWGRNKESTQLKDACQGVLTTLEQYETGSQSCDGNLALAVLTPIQLACGSSNVKVVELALGAIHKLVAHAWLQGESSTSEDLIADESDVVTRIIKLVIKCGEISNPTIQLSVIRALLTFATAEHFIAHGDSLMAAVRTVFNLALGSEDENIKRTACNALLQMLNTIAKRVTTYHLHSPSNTHSRRTTDHGDLTPTSSLHLQPAPHTLEGHHSLSHSISIGQGGSSLESSSNNLAASGSAAAGADDAASDARTARLASLAEQRDIRGLEAAIGASGQEDAASKAQLSLGGAAAGGAAPSGNTTDGAPTAAAASAPTSTPAPASAKPAATAAQRLVPLVQLTVAERDVLLGLTAFCKLASREAGLTEVEAYLHQVGDA